MRLVIEGEKETLWGFRQFWAMHVTGFNPRFHCMKCLEGVRALSVHRSMALGTPLSLPPLGDFFYVCGVATSWKWEENFHLVVRAEPGKEVWRKTHNGLTVKLKDAAAVAIPDLPDGWEGLPAEFTRCRNFRFGVASYGRT